ncbi:iron-hydroxamate ABC transporter substrate-binding protein [Paenibacillus medicaginis]|uniref:Iron-hydroxamate ABC transporter substrate-binding protein n=1 Tax=Paenibacillus medicaginis TaxID=1470560 RepID=A0ABV5C6S0_9BACL
MYIHQVRKWAFVVFTCLMIGVLAACGKTSTPSAANSGESAGSTNSTEAVQSETIKYQASNGVIEIPRNPARVVEVADSYVGDLLVLGIKPVGVNQQALENPYFEGKLDGVENLGDGQSFEQILELKPDLIIAPGWADASLIESYSKIAPTVAIKFGELPLREQLREFGKMTGKEAEAETWIAAWDQKIAAVKPQVQAAVGDKTVSILQPYAKGIYAFGHNFGRGGDILYGELELKAPPIIQKEAIDSGQGWANLSLEKLPEYAGDYIFTNAWSGDDADPSAVYESSLWKNLPAVKNNLVFMTNRKGDLFNDPISLEAQLEFILDCLLERK